MIKAAKHSLFLMLLLLPTVVFAQKIHIAFLWHMHQPIYYPGETIVETESASHYEYSLYSIHADRGGPYTGWVSDALDYGINAELPHFGTQVSISGTLIENLNNLEDAGVNTFSDWVSEWNNSLSYMTSSDNHRLDLVAFGYFHPLMGLIDNNSIRYQIDLHRDQILETFDQEDYSRGMFPPENAFHQNMIPALESEGIEWVLVDNVHFDRACAGYPYNTGGNLYEPNGAAIVNPDPGDWLQLHGLWAPTQVSAKWGHTPHRVKHINPETGEESSIIAVPASRYLGNEDGRGGFGALQYDEVMSQFEAYNDDEDHPILIVLHHDGDNHGGGTDSYYHHNFNNFVNWVSRESDRFECTTIQDYLDAFPPDENDFIHVEPGSWSGADNGDPEFLKWNGDPDGNGYSPDRNSWSIVTAASNIVSTIKDNYPDHPSVFEAERFLMNAMGSDYWYWDWAQNGIWDSHPARACNLAIDQVSELINDFTDNFGPDIFLPQRQPYNPGAMEWTVPQSSVFEIWTYVYDISGLAQVELKIREDFDGSNSTHNSDNETYSGGSDVGEWISISMNSAMIPSQTDPLPYYQAELFTAAIDEYTNTYLDYYVEALDSLGNISKSPISHVVVGNLGGGNSFIMDGLLDDSAEMIASNNNFELYAACDGINLYIATNPSTAAGNDVFILLSSDPDEEYIAAPWAKSGEVISWDAYLASETDNGWCGWFDQQGQTACASSQVLEGIINIAEEWSDTTSEIHLAVAHYQSHDAGQLVDQIPAGNDDGNIDSDEFILYEFELSDIRQENTERIASFVLHPPYPNPFNNKTNISFELSLPGRASLAVYNIQGQLVETLVDKNHKPGPHTIIWDAPNHASGTYLIRLKSASGIKTQKILIVK